MLAGAHAGGSDLLSGCLSKSNDSFTQSFWIVIGEGRVEVCTWAGCAACVGRDSCAPMLEGAAVALGKWQKL